MRIRVLQSFADRVREDLQRPHPIAAERVGFIYGRVSRHAEGAVVILNEYCPVDEDGYMDDPTAGATIGSAAIRSALQRTLSARLSTFHVHLHELGWRDFSPIDTKTIMKLSPSFCAAASDQLHGGIVLTTSSAIAKIWNPTTSKLEISPITFIGNPMRFADAWSSK